jgi:aspartyl-tRNA(Asn)/glutamyl-tRNA(Gln) amidotransferase subunit C
VSPSSLTPDQVRWIAHLARLDLTDAELAVLAPQLDAIVGYFNLLSEVDVSGVEPLAHSLPVQNVFRDDEPGESLPVEQGLANAPDRRPAPGGGAFFGVPPVLE